MSKPTTPRRLDLKTMSLCILAAIVFWLMNALNKDGYSTKLAYPLRVSYNDSLYIPTSPLPRQIQVKISGRGWSLLRKALSFNVLPVVYSVAQPLKAKFINTSSLTDIMSEQVRDVKVNYVFADTLDIEFDHKTTKTVRLKIDSLGINLRKPFVVSSVINLTPQTVTFEGPASVLKDFHDTLLVRVTDRKIDTDYDATLTLDYPRSPWVKANHETIKISFEVAALQMPLSEAAPPPSTKKILKK